MDRSAELTTALAAVPPGGTYELRGEWQVDFPVSIPGGVTVECDAVLHQSSDGTDLQFPYPPPRYERLRGRSFLKLLPGANLTGTLRLVGTNTTSDYVPELEAQHGLTFRGNNVVDGDITVENVWGDGFYVRGDNITVRGVDVVGTGRQGVGVTDGDNILIERCSFDRVSRSVFDIEPVANMREPEVVTNLTVRDCLVGSWGLGFTGGSGGFVVASLGNGYVDGVLFDGLRCTRGLAVSVGNNADEPVRRANYLFRRCVGEKPRNKPAFNFRNIDGYEVTDSTAPFGSASTTLKVPFIRADDCTDKTVSGNSFPGYSTELQEI